LKDEDIQKIRQLLIEAGYILHKSNRLTYPQHKIARSGNLDLSIYRGLPPWKAKKVSGIGIYDTIKTADSIRLCEMFSFPDNGNLTCFDSFIKTVKWKGLSKLPEEIEYLNISKPATDGYWGSNPPKNGFVGITICRTKAVPKRYTLLKYGDTLKSYEMPEWLTILGEYRRFSIVLRIKNGLIPRVKFSTSDHTTTIKFDYLLPPPEQNFTEIFSWSTEMDIFGLKGRLSRIIQNDFVPIFTDIFERNGYEIIGA
jgi:hypothetical protein